jgi:hypothetical protein
VKTRVPAARSAASVESMCACREALARHVEMPGARAGIRSNEELEVVR